METASEALRNTAWATGAAYRRLDVPKWPFVFRGLLPLLGLLLVTLFALTRFAGYRIEQQTTTSVRTALDASGHSWAQLAVSGQQVTLSGSAPAPAAGESALGVARDATCPTWLGPKACAISVSGAFGAVTSDADWPDLRATIESGVITLAGEVPDETSRADVIGVAQESIRAGRVNSVVDDLTLASAAAPAAFTAMAERVAAVAGFCTSGEAALTGGALSVRCRVSQSLESEIQAIVAALPPGGSLGDVTLVVAEDADACERDLAGLLQGSRIEFASGSANIVPGASALLGRVAEIVRGCPGTLRVEGHTDSTGDPDANQLLSAARAEAVRAALIARGIPLDRLVAVGYGQDNPVAGNDTPEGRARNRRIEIRVTLDAN